MKIFLLPSDFSTPDCYSHVKGKRIFLQNIDVQFFPSNCGHFISVFHPVFYFYFKNTKKFKIGPKLTVLVMFFFQGTIFFEAEIHLYQKIAPELQIDCEKISEVISFCETQCEKNSSHNVSHITRLCLLQ